MTALRQDKKDLEKAIAELMVEFKELSKTGGVVNLYEAIKMAQGMVKIKS